MTEKVDRFRLAYDYLSNFYPAVVEVDGIVYLSSEAAYQAAKCADFSQRRQFSQLAAHDAKNLGRAVAVRSDWEAVKIAEMTKIIRAKFTQNPHLARFLVETGDAELVEGNNWHDVYWGVDLRTDEGENHLGKILMALRQDFQQNGLPPLIPKPPLLSQCSEDGLTVCYQDITLLDCTCIVNAANKTLLPGGGVDIAIHRAAGAAFTEECRRLGGCPVAGVRLTAGYQLPAKWVIHTVGPHYGEKDDANLLALAYRNVLNLAAEHQIHQIAFPAISAGKFSYPKEQATAVAVKSVREWKRYHPDYPLQVIFCCLDLNVYKGFCQAIGLQATGLPTDTT